MGPNGVVSPGLRASQAISMGGATAAIDEVTDTHVVSRLVTLTSCTVRG